MNNLPVTNTSVVSGGNGGAGGASTGTDGGGSGGDGGAGILLINTSQVISPATLINNQAVTGGSGGAGGAGSSGGSGGAGADGIEFNVGGTLVNTSTVSGGTGGAAGSSTSYMPKNGAGGIGVAGSNLTIVNTGTISGGLGGNNSGQGAAISFGGGTNTLIVSDGGRAGGGIGGIIGITGAGSSLTIGGTVTVGTTQYTSDPVVTLTSAIVGTGSVFANGGQTLNLFADNTYSGGTTIENGTILGVDRGNGTAGGLPSSSIGSGGLNFVNGGTLRVSPTAAAPLSFTNNVTVDGSGGTFDTNGAQLTMSGVIGDGASAGSITATGGGTLVLSNTNTYSGGTTIAGTTTSNVATTLVVNNSNIVNGVQQSSIGSGPLTLDEGILQSGTNTPLTFNNSITITSRGGTLDANGGSLTFTGGISDAQSGGGGGLTIGQGNGGTVELDGPSSYSGLTTINSGSVLVAGSADAIADTDFAVYGELDLNGNSAGIGSLYGYGSITTNGGDATLSVNPSGAPNFSGNIADGLGQISVIIAGSGTQIFSGTNDYSGGTTVSSGTLQLAHASSNGTIDAAGTGMITVDDGTSPTTAGALELAASGTLANGLTIGVSSGVAVVAATPGTSATLGGTIMFGPGTAQFGTGTDTGTIVFAPNGSGNTPAVTGAPATLEVAGGTLQAGNTALGGVTMNAGTTTQIDSGATLDFNGNAATIANLQGSGTLTNTGATTSIEAGSFSGAIAAGAVAKTGAGTLQLNGQSGYAGGTNVQGGTLAIGNQAALGTGTVTLDPGTILAFAAGGLNLSNAVTLAGPGTSTLDTGANAAAVSGLISGDGGLAKAGSGTLVLPGGNTYAGGTALNVGTIAIGSSSSLGIGGLAMADGTTLAFAANNLNLGNAVSLTGTGTVDTGANVATLSGSVSGSGGLAKAGTGALVLTGSNSYAGGTLVEAGTLDLGNAAAAGTGAVSLDAGTILAFTNSFTFANPIAFPQVGDPTIDTGPNTVVISNVISGPGDLTKIGSGTLILTAANTYTGATTVAVGTLVVTGSTANSAATVDPQAVLGGSGTIGGLNVLSGGTAAPGVLAPYSTLHVGGNVTFNNGSTFAVQINPAGQTDAIAATGTATLNGGTLQITAGNGVYSTNTVYQVLTAAGGRTGTFSYLSSSTNFAFLAPTVTYTPNAVDVMLARTTTSPGTPVGFASVAATPNQAATAAAIDGLGRGPLYNAVLSQSVAGARQAFETASGEAHASAQTVATQDTRLFGNIVLDRLWNIGSSNGPDAVDALGQFGGTTLPALVRCYAPVDGQAERPSNYVVWGQGIGSFGRLGGDGNASAVTQSLGGVAAGIDTRIEAPQFSNWRVGLAAGYTSDDFSSRNGLGSGTYQNVFGGLYAGARYGAIDLRFGGSYGGSWTQVNRTVAFPGFSEAEHSNYGGDTGQVFGEVGYRFAVNRSVVEPVAGAAFTHVGTDHFRESGGVAALVGSAESTDVGTTTFGFRGEAQLVAGLPVVARLFIAWQHAFGDVDPRSTVAFAAGSTPFTVAGAPIDRDSAVAEAGLEYRATPAMTLALSYLGQIGPRDDENAVKGRIDYRF